jgi:NTE family protein
LKKILKILLLILLLLQSGQLAISQELNARPKVGLALSGGGALGMAHVGVLKVMEEAGLRPDYITGVSMGSIVGGMYSLGYSADSLYKIMKRMNWNLILSNNIEENKVIFAEKEHFNNSIISLPLTSRKVTLPSGLINGQQIENIFSYYAWPAAGINDFSKLPIPFMCLAVDILTGKKVELRSGYLPDAMRASSAVPTFFTPIKIDSALLVDGGVIRNYAAEEVREMGADIVIGSYTGYRIKSEDELKSLPGIIQQIVFQRSHEDYQEQKKITDLLLEPKVRDFPSTMFSNVDTLVERGYKAASPYREYFRKLADSLDIIGPQKPLENILDNQIWSFDKIEVTGNVLYADYQIRGVLGIAAGDKVDKKILSDKIDILYGKTWFEKVKYRIASRNDSLILVIDCIERPKSMLYGGVHYDNTIKAGIIFRMTSKDLITKKSFIDFDSFIGQFYRFNLTMFQYIDRNERIGLSADFHTDNSKLPMLRIRNEPGSAFYRNNYAGLTISKYLGLNHLMNLTFSLHNSSLSPDYIAFDHLKRISYKYLSEGYTYKINTIDTKHFPNKGLIFQFSVITSKLLSGKTQTDSYKKTYTREFPDDFLFKRSYSVTGDMRRYFSAGRRVTLMAGWDVMFTHTKDSVTSPHNYYFAGGEESSFTGSIPFTGFHNGEIAVDRFAGLRFDADLEFYKDLHLSLLTNIAIAREPGIIDDLSILGGYGLVVGYMSIIGPVKIGFMHGFSSSERYYGAIKGYISIGFNF